jgi:hypothetical protein
MPPASDAVLSAASNRVSVHSVVMACCCTSTSRCFSCRSGQVTETLRLGHAHSAESSESCDRFAARLAAR